MLPQRKQEENKSFARQFTKRQVKQQVKKQGKKAAKKLAKNSAKFALKIAKVLLKKLFMVVLKLLAAIGLPTILVAIGVIIAVVIIILSFSWFMGTGEGLSGEDKAIHEYIVQQANGTVNMKSSIERPYRVPEKLIAATIQLEAFKDNDDLKAVIKKMANSLAPTFDYGKYDEWKEKQVTVCEDGKCKVGKVQHTENMVTKIDHVDYWNGSTDFTYTKHVSDWKSKTVTTYKTIKVPAQKGIWTELKAPNSLVNSITDRKYPYYDTDHPVYDELIKLEKEQNILGLPPPSNYTMKVYVKKFVTVMVDKKITIKTTTKTRQQYFTSTKQTTTDYATFDSILNSYGLGLNDKKMIEANYLFIGGQIAYTEWLQTMGTGDLGYGGGFIFDGTIIPGAGVPPQYMPFYRAAEKKYSVSWNVIAAIHFVETGFSTHPTMVSSVGAVGHVQVRP
jgi:hypothetical protein